MNQKHQNLHLCPLFVQALRLTRWAPASLIRQPLWIHDSLLKFVRLLTLLSSPVTGPLCSPHSPLRSVFRRQWRRSTEASIRPLMAFSFIGN